MNSKRLDNFKKIFKTKPLKTILSKERGWKKYLEMQSQLNTKETVSIHFISYLVRGDDGEFL